MMLKVCCFVSLIGLLKGATTPSPLNCFTQPPGRSPTNRVMSCLDKYAVIPEQLYCQKTIRRHPLSVTEKDEIEDKHNEIRRGVSPLAANMLTMKYAEGLGRTAQVWAEMCQLQSSKMVQRYRPGSFAAGENVFVSQKNMTWSDVIKTWAQENSSFTFGSSSNNHSLVSNYLQLVWAKTSAVGCAKSECGGKFFYVCHYAPGMNYDHIDTPYNSTQTSCSQCSKNCTNKLCDCKGIICLNGGEINYDTCLCDCINTVSTYDPPTCELRCGANGDDAKCGTTYRKSNCRSSFETMFHCPWMCDICPYAGKNYTEGSEPLPWERNRKECPSPTTTTPAQKISQATGVSRRQTQETQSTPAPQQGGNGCSCNGAALCALVLVFVQTFLSIVK